MLVEFSVTNFRSFKDRKTFSLVASANKELIEDNTFLVNNKLRILRSSVIYGANASGKSNLFAAFQFFQNFIISSGPGTQQGDIIDVDYFKFDRQMLQHPSEFEIIFYLDEIRYRYGISVDREKIHTEYLFAINKVKEIELFTRVGQKIHINSANFKEGKIVTKDDAVRENAACLSVCAQLNGMISGKIIDYLKTVKIYSGLFHHANSTIEMLENKDVLPVVTFLQNADTQITNLKIEKVPYDFSEFAGSELDEIAAKILLGKKVTKIFSSHTLYDGKDPVGEEFIEMKEESAGTRKLFSFAGPIIDVIKNGGVIFIDEFDSQFHPYIIESIVKIFNSKKHNPLNAQIVFASHSVHIMTNTLFRRDQIWFCEKNMYGATDLYSLVEYKDPVRNDASFSKNYLLGKYGAVPFIENILN